MARGADFPAPAAMLPHRGESLLIDRVLEHDGDSTTVLATVGSSSWLANREGEVPSWIAIELMAQGIGAHEGVVRIGAHEGVVRPTRGDPPLGYLVSVTKLRLHRASLHADERLQVRARLLRRSPGIGIASYACEIDVEQGERQLARVADGTVSILIPGRDS